MSRLGAGSVPVVPFCLNCPLCKANHALQIRGSEEVFCTKCWWVGDAIQLYAKVLGLNIKDAVAAMEAEGLLAREQDALVWYFADVEEQERLRACFADGREYYKSAPSLLAGILRECLGFHNATSPVLSALAPYVALLRRKDLEEHDIELPKKVNHGISVWGQYAGLAIPTYDRWRITGAWIICPGGTCHVHFLERQSRQGFGFSLMTPVEPHQRVFVCPDPVLAARYLFRQALDEANITPILVPALESSGDCPTTMGARQLIYWTPKADHANWYKRATRAVSAQLVQNWKTGWDVYSSWPNYRATGSKIMHDLAALALPACHTVARWLLETKDPAHARRLATTMELTSDVQALCRSYCQGGDSEQLAGIFSADQRHRRVELDGEIVTETDNGWQCGNVMVSNAILRILWIRHDRDHSDNTVGGGVVVFKGRAYRFETNYRELRYNGGKFIEKLLLDEQAGFPTINKKWATDRLWQLAHLFHEPKIEHATLHYGWTDGVLRISSFVVDGTGVAPVNVRVEGPAIPVPMPLSSPELTNFQYQGFCRVGLALLGNLVRTWTNERPLGITILNGPHLIDKIAQAFSSEVVRNPSDALLGNNDTNPLPMFTSWSDHRLAEVLRAREPFRNFMWSVDRKTHVRLAGQPGWLRIIADPRDSVHNSAKPLDDYQALRWVFLALPAIMRAGKPAAGPYFYSALGALVAKHWLPANTRHVLPSAGSWLDQVGNYTDHSRVYHLMSLLSAASDEGYAQLDLNRSEDTATLDMDGVHRYLVNSLVPVPGVEHILEELTGARQVLRRQGNLATFGLSNWNLYASTRATDEAAVLAPKSPPGGLAPTEDTRQAPQGGLDPVDAKEAPQGG